MPPVVIAGAIAGAGAIGAAALGSSASNKAAKSAANTAANTTTQNNALSRDIYNQNKALLSPYVQAGLPANDRIGGMLGLGTSDQQQQAQEGFRNYLRNSDYGFQFGEGANRLNTGYAANGSLQSGAAMKALEGYRQNLQDGYRGQYMSLLGNQQALGMGAASAVAGVGQNYVGNVTANNNSAGSASANAALMNGANQASLYGAAGNTIGNLAGLYYQSSYGGGR